MLSAMCRPSYWRFLYRRSQWALKRADWFNRRLKLHSWRKQHVHDTSCKSTALWRCDTYNEYTTIPFVVIISCIIVLDKDCITVPTTARVPSDWRIRYAQWLFELQHSYSHLMALIHQCRDIKENAISVLSAACRQRCQSHTGPTKILRSTNDH